MILPVLGFILAGSLSVKFTEELFTKSHQWYETASIVVCSYTAVVIGIRIFFNQFEFGGIRGLGIILKDLFFFSISIVLFPYLLSTVLEISSSIIDFYGSDPIDISNSDITKAVAESRGILTVSFEYIINCITDWIIEFSKFTYNYLVLICFGLSPVIMYLSIIAKVSNTLRTFFSVLSIAVLWPVMIQMSAQVIIAVFTLEESNLSVLSLEGAGTLFSFAFTMLASPAILWVITGGGNPFSASGAVLGKIGGSYGKTVGAGKWTINKFQNRNVKKETSMKEKTNSFRKSNYRRRVK